MIDSAIEDEDLILKAQQNPENFAILYSKYVNKIYNFIYFRVDKNSEVAEDLTAELFTRALKNIKNFQCQGFPYSAYLYKIARSICQEHYSEKITINIDDVVIKDNAHVTISEKSDLLLLWERIRELKPPLPEIFELHYLEGKTFEEIGEIIGKKSGAIRTAMSRAINELKQNYESI